MEQALLTVCCVLYYHSDAHKLLTMSDIVRVRLATGDRKDQNHSCFSLSISP